MKMIPGLLRKEAASTKHYFFSKSFSSQGVMKQLIMI
jgi:hypothetical protein